ncbi:NAD(P)/FAD-dependent oxidoreductase [Oculatella sp. LEGE 06141]|uniref:NAD(P)/FAD-dependent oxidoreductase n=1 Tax=Oculatella sp. LEGE 06141 TaxID=1828648 RepID=UPI0018821104|nr:NAD(P)/FAD-dependent oxidoreductase [Oculatella sp. LEGE 06141]MBE9177343.1 NAD(P)/FAD-dependent oxidoreductase [Oculatella sp. LEGE 06141]
MQALHVVVIGGGAAGFFGAIACAEAHPQVQVTLIEASRHPLHKVKISGGGRCNVTHSCFEPALLVQHYPRGGKALRGAFSRFQPRNTVDWFNRHGVRLKTEADGRMFPVTDDSATVVDCFSTAARQAGVTVRVGTPVEAVTRAASGFRVVLKTGESLRCDRLLLATGSNPHGYQLAQSLGHSVEAPVPSLFTFNIPDRHLHELAGVAIDPAQVRLHLPDAKPLKQQGALLITHWGMSGPAVLKLSAWGARVLHQHQYRASLQVNWLPHQTPDQIRQDLLQAKAEQPKKAIASSNPSSLPRRLWQYLAIVQAGIAPETQWAQLSKTALNQLVQALSQSCYSIKGKGVFKDEFVTCGGVRLKEVDFKSMESRLCPGLFFAGEILDIDGITGGFNFQSAWTTGWLAGQAIGAAAVHPVTVP